MENRQTTRLGISGLYRLCPARHILMAVSAGLILLHLVLRSNHALMSLLSENLVHPLHLLLARLNSLLPFSMAELLIGLAAAAILVYIIYSIIMLIQRREKAQRLYRILVTLLTVGLGVYALFCVMWGTYYYGDDFERQIGLEAGEISVEQLKTVTAYFAELTNRYSLEVERDADNVCCTDKEAVISRSAALYDEVAEKYPCLEGERVAVKGVHFSRVMSYTDFTGFFFPFTAEANVNTDFPSAMFASTAAHEIAHQRGVAKEQEANFVAVLASLENGDADFCYSACLLAYTHLGNALYTADYDAWKQVYLTLNEYVLADYSASSAYWKQFETPVQTVSNNVYEGFLKSYDQTLGLKSYGACVDLLVNYYYNEAAEYFS